MQNLEFAHIYKNKMLFAVHPEEALYSAYFKIFLCAHVFLLAENTVWTLCNSTH